MKLMVEKKIFFFETVTTFKNHICPYLNVQIEEFDALLCQDLCPSFFNFFLWKLFKCLDLNIWCTFNQYIEWETWQWNFKTEILLVLIPNFDISSFFRQEECFFQIFKLNLPNFSKQKYIKLHEDSELKRKNRRKTFLYAEKKEKQIVKKL